jgi:ribosome recycling factor
MRKGKSYLKKHNKIVKDYEKQKSRHLEKLTDKMLKNDEKAEKLKSKPIKGNFLKNF